MSFVSHGHSRNGSKTYKTWSSMKSRCSNPKDLSYPRYGGRGIKVCERWLNFAHFLIDMGERKEGMSIDRIDVNGDYEPSNCKWATAAEQQSNKRNSFLIECNGVKKTAYQWSALTGVNHTTIKRRIKAGVPPEVAVSMIAFKGKLLLDRVAIAAMKGQP